MNKEKMISTKIDRFREEINHRNCKNFVALGRGGVIITGFILIIGAVLNRFTEFVPVYGLIFLYTIALYALARLCQKKEIKDVRFIYYLAISPIMLGGILLGTFLDPMKPAITIMIMLCVMTLFIIDKPRNLFLYLGSVAILFAVCCYIAKSKQMFLDDLIDLLIYSSISIGITYFSLKDRVESAVNYCKAQTKSKQDTMTNLLNRGSGEEQARELVMNNKMGTFAIIDIDNFKSFNDNYGHQVGDEVICLLADRLKSVFRTEDIIFRLGGDEFAVYAPGLTESKICEQHFERLKNSLREARVGIGNVHTIEVSIGCTIYTSGNIDYETLYKKSDELLYEAKNNGKGQVVFGMI